LDSLESGARFRNLATCILHALVRQLSRPDHNYWPVDVVAELLLRGTGLIQSTSWLDTVRRLVQDSLWAIYSSNRPEQIVSRFRITHASKGTESPKQSAMETVETTDNNTSCLGWLFDPRSLSPLVVIRGVSSAQKVPSTQSDTNRNNFPLRNESPHSVRKINVDQLFEPHGGVDVIVYLLGQIVCYGGTLSRPSQSLTRLQAHTVCLLFGLTWQSIICAFQFHAPTLPDPGVESPVRSQRRPKKYPREPWTQPLSRGDTLLARLIKHPGLAADSARLQEVSGSDLVCTCLLVWAVWVDFLCIFFISHTDRTIKKVLYGTVQFKQLWNKRTHLVII
uniref:FRY n=1 Tax=Echinostoma caproni TaxID=27848 RepID=A0A183B3P6_9TREM